MASSPQTVSHNSASAARGNQGSLSTLLRHVERSTLPPRLRPTLTAILVIANGGGSKGELYPATQTIAEWLGVSYWTVQRHIDVLVFLGTLIQIYGPNNKEIPGVRLRRPTTYRLNQSTIVSRHKAAVVAMPPKSAEAPPLPPAPPPSQEKPPQNGNGHRIRKRPEQTAEEILAVRRGECIKHPQSGKTAWGTCWACYRERNDSEEKPPP